MAVITKSDLVYKYTWSADQGDNPHYTGLLDRNKVDRDEGHEVVHFPTVVPSLPGVLPT
jgi:hypothetical protein